MAITDDPFTTFNFEVQLVIPNAASLGLTRPVCDEAFSECDGLEMSMEPKSIREGGNNSRQINLIGPVKYGNLTLKRGMTANLDLWKWFAAVTGTAARGAKASGVVVMRDGSGADTLRFSVSDILPIKIKAPGLNAKDGILAIEEMQLAYGSFTIEQA